MSRTSSILGWIILILAVIAGVVWWAAWREDRGGILTVSFLDIGQGDAIFIDSPSGRQVLIDGGAANGGVVRKLGEVMPWYDHSIDVVIGTHPDADHIGGLPAVLNKYHVDSIFQSSVLGSTPTWGGFEDTARAARASGANIFTAERGEVIDLGKGAYLEVLSPDRSVPHIDTNTGCIVTRLVYGKTAFMLSCDAPQSVENYLASLDGVGLHANVLKAGHHGSKNSSSPTFLGLINPEFGVFSRGCTNKYGHPAPEVVARFARFGIHMEDTCKQGTVTFISDGEKVTLR